MLNAKPINTHGLAIVDALTVHNDRPFTFAEIVHMADLEPKTGYLTAAKKIAADRYGMTIEKVANAVTVKVKTITVYPSGLEVETEKEVLVDGYRLVKVRSE